MPLFEYTARNPQTGQIQKGQLDVPSKDDVTSYLRKNRMMLVSLREAPKPIKLNLSFGKPSVKTRDIVIFTRQFATMINAGLPLVQSLDILSKQTENPTLRDVTRAVVFDVEAGNTLADAFRKHPSAFTSQRRAATILFTSWPSKSDSLAVASLAAVPWPAMTCG